MAVEVGQDLGAWSSTRRQQRSRALLPGGKLSSAGRLTPAAGQPPWCACQQRVGLSAMGADTQSQPAAAARQCELLWFL